MRSRFRIIPLLLNLALVPAGLALTSPIFAQQLQPKPTPATSGGPSRSSHRSGKRSPRIPWAEVRHTVPSSHSSARLTRRL
jgi:hypothetical protein